MAPITSWTKKSLALQTELLRESEVYRKQLATGEEDENAKSPFFAKFSPEIRNIIYTHLFGDCTVHVWFDRTPRDVEVIGHNRCSGKPLPIVLRPGVWVQDNNTDHCINEITDLIPMHALRTCRKFYAEAALVPYSSSNFRIHRVAFSRFMGKLLPAQK